MPERWNNLHFTLLDSFLFPRRLFPPLTLTDPYFHQLKFMSLHDKRASRQLGRLGAPEASARLRRRSAADLSPSPHGVHDRQGWAGGQRERGWELSAGGGACSRRQAQRIGPSAPAGKRSPRARRPRASRLSGTVAAVRWWEERWQPLRERDGSNPR